MQIKNAMFQKVAVKCKDGSMLHLLSRQEVDINKIELDETHLESMLNQGYWLCEYISISEIILKGPAKYIKAFLYTETDDNDLTYFIIYHLGVVKRSITALQDYIKKKQAEVKDTEKELREIGLFNHRQRALVSHALRHPGYEYSIKSHMISHDIAYETARSDLNELVEKGLLQSQKISNTWTYSPVTDIQDKLKGLRWRDF